MSEDYKHNHYVPQWYQKRFLTNGRSKHHYLDLKPEVIKKGGRKFTRKALLNWGPKKCFAQDDLYTTRWGDVVNHDIEKFFFGTVDAQGKRAVEHFSDWTFNGDSADALYALLRYMSVQKLRTPKGLGWLKQESGRHKQNRVLILLQEFQNLFCTIWSECVWQIADASKSDTKFIISDHPVTVYNRDCFAGSKTCRGYGDPDIRQAATHTYFPLSPEKVLIFTNLSWVRDPFQNPLNFRPNPDLMRPAKLFNFLDIQVDRFLSEEEVIEINFITKQRAHRYVAAAKKEWLFPEEKMKSQHWRKLGDGYLFMPDPRHINGGGEIFVRYGSGDHDSWDDYGHKPWQQEYGDQARNDREWKTLNKFKAEWAATYGRKYRGIVHRFASSGKPPPTETSEEYHASECARDKKFIIIKGERARRQKLKR